jgi:hypothetical protein
VGGESYVPALEGDGWWPDITDPGVRGIDQFLADEASLSRGLGSAMGPPSSRSSFRILQSVGSKPILPIRVRFAAARGLVASRSGWLTRRMAKRF